MKGIGGIDGIKGIEEAEWNEGYGKKLEKKVTVKMQSNFSQSPQSPRSHEKFLQSPTLPRTCSANFFRNAAILGSITT